VSRGRELLEKLVQDVPGFAPSRNLYAEMLETAGETAAAKQQRIAAAGTTRFREADDPWIEALNDSCYDPKRLLVLGTIEYQTEHGDHGTGYLERAFALAPSDRETCQALAELYLKLKQPDKARIALERGLQTVKPPAVMLYVDLGEAYRALHRWDDAMRVVRDGQTVFPDAFQLHNETGAILGDQQRHEEAIAAYTRARALAPNDTDSNFSLGLELLKLGRNAEGKEYVKRALRLQPQFPGALAVLGKLELEAGNLEAAAGYLKPLYDSRPDSEYSRQLLAQWHLRAGDAAAAKNDHATALREYSAGFELDPRNAALATRAGTAWLVAGKPAEAIPPLEALYKLKPADPQSSLYLGGAYARIGRVDDARRLLQQGEELAQKAGNSETAAYCREMLSQLR
jgi:HemY protein